MGIFGNYNINLLRGPEVGENSQENSQEKSEGGDIDYGKQLNEITNKIKELSNDNNENDEAARNDLNKQLESNFINGMKEYLKSVDNRGKIEELKSSIQKILSEHINEANYKTEYKGLIELALALGMQGYSSKEEYYSRQEELFQRLDVRFGIHSGIDDNSIQGLEDDKTTQGCFYENGKRTTENPEFVNEINNNLQAQLNRLTPLLKCYNNDSLKKVEKLLKNIQIIIKNPIQTNVQVLQQYVFDNLDTDGEKNEFKTKNKYNESTEKFDGKFGESTLNGVKIILNKTDEYIAEVEKYLAEDTQDREKLDEITPKDNPTIQKTENNASIDPKNLLNIPDGTNVELEELSDEDKKKLQTPGLQEITLKVKIGNESKDFNIKVTVEESTGKITKNPEKPNESTKSAEPLKFNEGTYKVMRGGSDIANKVGLPGAIFYSTKKCEPVDKTQSTDVVIGSQQVELTEETGTIEVNGDSEYYVKLPNHPDMIYKVKVDSLGYLCPIAEEINTKLKYSNGSNVKTYTLFMNNVSCKQYLRNKLPGEIRDKCVINWNPGHQDYQLVSYDHWLTIEPMTIAGDWIGKGDDHLSKSLAFLNLANYTRSIGVKYDSPDPDVNRRVSKIRGIKYEGKKVHMDISDDDRVNLGLGNAAPEELARFKRYNNGEQWEENRNEKRKNVYKKIDF